MSNNLANITAKYRSLLNENVLHVSIIIYHQSCCKTNKISYIFVLG